MTSCTPASPRAFKERKNAVQKAPSSQVADIEPEHLAAAVAGDSGGDHHRLGDDPMVNPGLAIGGVEEDIRIAGVAERAVTERRHLNVEVDADPRHLRLRDTRVDAQRLHQVVDLAGRHTMQIGLHHHREQRLIHPPPPLQQRREERPRPQLRDRQLQITGRGRQHPRSVTVPLRRPLRGAFPRASTNHRSQLGINQGLIDRGGRQPDPLIHPGRLHRLQHLK
jgi:hypothetical protein